MMETLAEGATYTLYSLIDEEGLVGVDFYLS